MVTITHQIVLGSTTLQSGKTSRLLDLETRADLGVPVNACRLVLDGQADVDSKPGDGVQVELGYDSTLTRVFTGQVTVFERGIRQIIVEALGSFSALTATRFNLLYEKQNAGDMVGDVLGRLKLSKGTLEDGEKFAAFAVSDHQPVWDTLQGLAQRCGVDFYADPEDKAVFQQYAPNKTHTFEYGADILEYVQEGTAAAVDGIEVYGESPVGQGQGEAASAWLTKKEVKGTAGKSSGKVLRIMDPAARTQTLARSLATHLLQTYQAEARGRLCVPGAPQVRLGDAVQVARMPVAVHNGTFKVTGVRHRLNARVGFVTAIYWEKG